MSQRRRSFIELPEELQIVIFLRLPVRCLLICKCVCKPFCAIIKNPNFTKNHLSRTRAITTDTSQSLLLGLTKSTKRPCSHSQNFLLSIDNNRDMLNSSPLAPPIPYVGALFLVGSCNGLICFDVRTNNGKWEDNFVLWNPVTRQTRYLPRPNNRDELNYSIIEFGFIPETNDYTVLKLLNSKPDNIQFGLYKMSTNSWKVYCNTSVGKFVPFLARGETSVFSNGCFHWGTGYRFSDYIVSFNLKDEELGIIKAVDRDKVSYFDHYRLTVVEEALAMIYWKFGDSFQIWVMADYGIEDSWVLKFDVSKHISSYLQPLGYLKYDMMIINLEKPNYLFNLNTQKDEKIPDLGSQNLISFCSFEETFAPVTRILF